MYDYLLGGLPFVGATRTTPLAAQVVPAGGSPSFHLNVAGLAWKQVQAVSPCSQVGRRNEVFPSDCIACIRG